MPLTSPIFGVRCLRFRVPLTNSTWTGSPLDAPSRLTLCRFVFLFGSRIVDLDPASGTQSAQNFVAACNYFVAFLQAVEHLDIGGARDPASDRDELCLPVAHDEYALNLLVFFPALWRRLFGRRRRSMNRSRTGFLLLQLSLGPNRQRLDGYRQNAAARGGRDLGRGREAGSQVERRILHRHYYLEILSFFTRR